MKKLITLITVLGSFTVFGQKTETQEHKKEIIAKQLPAIASKADTRSVENGFKSITPTDVKKNDETLLLEGKKKPKKTSR